MKISDDVMLLSSSPSSSSSFPFRSQVFSSAHEMKTRERRIPPSFIWRREAWDSTIISNTTPLTGFISKGKREFALFYP